jgi:hypothetical protein
MPEEIDNVAAPTASDAKFNLRIPAELYRWLTSYAHEQGRSANAQIIQLIKEERARQAAHEQPPVPPSPPADDDQV